MQRARKYERIRSPRTSDVAMPLGIRPRAFGVAIVLGQVVESKLDAD
jgi:hypothetical protein